MLHTGCVFVAGIPWLGHEGQDLLSPCNRLDLGLILSSERVLEEWSQNSCQLTPREKSPLPEARTYVAASHRTANLIVNMLLTELFKLPVRQIKTKNKKKTTNKNTH